MILPLVAVPLRRLKPLASCMIDFEERETHVLVETEEVAVLAFAAAESLAAEVLTGIKIGRAHV